MCASGHIRQLGQSDGRLVLGDPPQTHMFFQHLDLQPRILNSLLVVSNCFDAAPTCSSQVATLSLRVANKAWERCSFSCSRSSAGNAVYAPGSFENGIRIFGSSGDDIVYVGVARQRPKELEFLAMPPKMPSKLLLNADHRHRESHSRQSF